MPLAILSDPELETVIRTLPAAPRILAQLAQRLQAIDADIEQITATLRRDAALTARLIDMANSATFLGFDPATSIEDAVARVGFRETHRIIGAVASTQLADEPLAYFGINPRRLRENSLFCALVAEELSDRVGLDPGTAYTVGLLRSIGKVVLDRVARTRPGTVRFDPHRELLVNWERAMFGVTDPEIAARVLELWDFPADAVEALREHGDATVDASAAAQLLNLAAGAAEVHGLGLPGERGHWQWDEAAFARIGIDAEHAQWAAERASSILQRVSPVFA